MLAVLDKLLELGTATLMLPYLFLIVLDFELFLAHLMPKTSDHFGLSIG